jgi:hypothetical protein
MSNEGLELEINLEGEEIRAWGGQSGPKLPVGMYTFDIAEAVPEPSKKGNPALKVIFKVADEGEFFGVELTKKYSLLQQSLGRVKSLMIAAGARLDKVRTGDLIGARIIAEVIHTVGQGQVDAEGNVKEGGTYCDVTNEQAVAAPEPVPATPPAGKKATAPAAAAQPTKNGSVARRA